MAVLGAGDFWQSGAAIYFRKKNYHIMTEILPFIVGTSCLFTGIIVTWLVMHSQMKAQSAIHAEQLKAAEEKQALLDKAESRLTDTFKALSSDALKSTQDQFLILAKNNLQAQQQEAKNDLKQRQVAVEQLVKPISQTLEKVQSQLNENEKQQAGNDATLKQQIIHITDSNLGLKQETQKLVKALRQPHGRGQWGKSSYNGSSKWPVCRNTVTLKPKPVPPPMRENDSGPT